MDQFRYNFQKGSKKHLCQICEKKCFVRYVDLTTGDLLPEQYGRCDREVNCGNYLNPYTDGYAQMIDEREKGNNPEWKLIKPSFKKPVARPTAFFPFDVLKETQKDYVKNVFIQNLVERLPFPFPSSEVQKVISLYNLGTNNDYLPGMVTFPFIDVDGNIRAIQVKQFDKQNHTVKTTFLHSILKYQYSIVRKQPLPVWLESYLGNDKFVSCLFGEHLLRMYPANPVALVEAPKTAVIGTIYYGFPSESPKNLLWLGVFNLSSLNPEKCRALKGRKVFLFPDLSKPDVKESCYQLWSKKAEEITKTFESGYFIVSDYLEKNATDAEKEKGLDLADYLVQYDYRLFRRLLPNKEQERPVIIEPLPEQVLTSQEESLIEKDLTTSIEFPQSEEEKTPDQPGTAQEERPPFATKQEVALNTTPPEISFEVEELESFFNSHFPPESPLKLDPSTIITDIPLFVRSHMATIKANHGKRSFKPYFDRLQLLKEIIKNPKNN